MRVVYLRGKQTPMCAQMYAIIVEFIQNILRWSPNPPECSTNGPGIGQSVFRSLNIVIIVQLGMPYVIWLHAPTLVF